jgi:TIR domain
MHPFRVFLSYTAKDQQFLDTVVAALHERGLCPWWDQQLEPGRLFLDEIKQKIATAHLFMPLLTSTSNRRPWVHHETGFALGVNVPVLPIVVDTLPKALLAGMQALVVRENLSDLKTRLLEVDLESIILPLRTRPPVLYSIADLPESRTETLVAQGTSLVPFVASSRIRQRALFSSFSIPDEPPTAKVWNDLDREQPRSTHYRGLLRQERQLLERQAKRYGCTLIITPLIDPGPVGPLVHQIRVENLIRFLESIEEDLVDIVFADSFSVGNETILGDVLLGRALPPQPIRDYQQTLFTSHAPTVLQACRAFDESFRDECRRQNLPPTGLSVKKALDALQARLRELSFITK